MFWLYNMKPNRCYLYTTHESLHISQAALDGESSHGGVTEIWMTTNFQRFLMCTLRKEVREQALLNLNFPAGSVIGFQNCGSGNVTLSGYTIEEQDLGDQFMYGDRHKEDSESDESEDERKKRTSKKNIKKAKRGRGRGGVIKGSQKVGAKVGGKRRNTCLAHMA